jgi:hypothetical protein
MSIATALAAIIPDSVKDVLEKLMLSVDAFWQDNRLPTKRAVAVTQRLLRLSDRIEVLLARFRAGKVKWRKRAERVAVAAAPGPEVSLDPAEAAALADAALHAAKARAARGRTKVHGLPPHYGWLGEQMPGVAITAGSDLEAAFRTEEMCALMLATPEVARIAGPVFRMFGLDEQVLLVPDGYTGPGVPKNRPFYAPEKEKKKPVRVSDYQPNFILPEGYDEETDGRKPHPLRDPGWNYWSFENYRSYIYFYLGLKPATPEFA